MVRQEIATEVFFSISPDAGASILHYHLAYTFRVLLGGHEGVLVLSAVQQFCHCVLVAESMKQVLIT